MAELCVTAPSGKGKLIPHSFSRISKSSFVFAATHNIVPFSYIYTRTQNSRGQKGGGISAWNEKGFSSLWPLDRPNIRDTGLATVPGLVTLGVSSGLKEACEPFGDPLVDFSTVAEAMCRGWFFFQKKMSKKSEFEN